MVELVVLPVHQRLAELHTIKRHRDLTPDENVEFKDCLNINVVVMRELANIKNASDLAFATNDTNWQQDICAQIEKVSKKFIRGGIYSG